MDRVHNYNTSPAHVKENQSEKSNSPQISDWDDDNVVVIDLTEDWSITSQKERIPLTEPKTGRLAFEIKEKESNPSTQLEILESLQDQTSLIEEPSGKVINLSPRNTSKVKQTQSLLTTQRPEANAKPRTGFEKLAPIKVRPWEQRNLQSANLSREASYQSHLQTNEDSDSSLLHLNSDSGSPSRTTPSTLSIRKKSGKQSSKRLLSGGHIASFGSSLESLGKEDDHSEIGLKSIRPYRGTFGRWTPLNDKDELLLHGFNPIRNIILDSDDTSASSCARIKSSMGCTTSASATTKMTRIEKNLFLGSMEAATDVILLESHAITDVVSVDSVPLPRKIASFLPRIKFLHLQISDLPDEDLLSCLFKANEFIDKAIHRGGVVLVHCFKGRSRSATVVIAYLMHKHHYKLEKAFYKVKNKREGINPHVGFLAQLKMFEAMEFSLDPANIQYKMFRLYCASEQMRKAKILFRDSLDKVLDTDPAGGLPGSNEATAAAISKCRYPMIFKCRKCKRTLASAFNMLPHVRGETPNWMDDKWSRLNEEDVVDDVGSSVGLDLCSQSVFITPVSWMEHEIKQNLGGKLYCPNCQVRVGNYSWVVGEICKACGATVLPAFQLDMTEIIFRTHNRYLQSGIMTRGPILV